MRSEVVVVLRALVARCTVVTRAAMRLAINGFSMMVTSLTCDYDQDFQYHIYTILCAQVFLPH